MNSGSLLLLRYDSQNTKSPALIFSALLAENDTQKVRFEWFALSQAFGC